MQDGTPIIIKRKKSKKHAHHGGAWKVAYADFVTAMMAFFMVMWIISLDGEDREVIQAYFRDPVGFSKTHPRNEISLRPSHASQPKPGQMDAGNAQVRQDMKDLGEIRDEIEQDLRDDPELREMLENQAIEIKLTYEGLVLEFIENEVNGEVFFKLGQSVVRPQARVVIAKIAPILGKAGRPMVMEGHTDALPFSGGGRDNYDLGYERASAVRKLLMEGGVAAGQFREVVSYAAQRPRVLDDPFHFSNRRVSILLPFREQKRFITGLPSEGMADTVEGIFRMPADGG